MIFIKIREECNDTESRSFQLKKIRSVRKSEKLRGKGRQFFLHKLSTEKTKIFEGGGTLRGRGNSNKF
jgi:hypothetical protein